jgi:hypothetical protein
LYLFLFPILFFPSSSKFCSFQVVEAVLVKNDQESNQYASKKV